MFRHFRNARKSIIILHPGWSNPGDGLVALGVRSVLEALGYKKIYEFSWDDYELWIPLFRPGEIHAVVLAGTPWIWDQCHKSDKFRRLHEMRRLLPNARWIMAGGGASFLAEHVEQNFQNAVADVSVFSDFTACITRDFVAQGIVEKVNKNTFLLPCPSALLPIAIDARFLTMEKMKKRLFRHDLRPEFMAPYLSEVFLAEYEKSCEERIREGFEPTRWGALQLAVERSEILLWLASTKTFYTSRVHAAICSFVLGAEGELYATDSRSFTAMHLGVPICGPYADLFHRAFAGGEVFEGDSSRWRKTFMKILDRAIN